MKALGIFDKTNCMKKYFFVTGFLKTHSTQNVLLVMIEKWKTILNEKLKLGALFMDLLKAFDTLDHSLLLAKSSAYGFDNNS